MEADRIERGVGRSRCGGTLPLDAILSLMYLPALDSHQMSAKELDFEFYISSFLFHVFLLITTTLLRPPNLDLNLDYNSITKDQYQIGLTIPATNDL